MGLQTTESLHQSVCQATCVNFVISDLVCGCMSKGTVEMYLDFQ